MCCKKVITATLNFPLNFIFLKPLEIKNLIKLNFHKNNEGIKHSVLHRQSRDTNRNIKWSVYCQYG